jgi:hypothetical protein
MRGIAACARFSAATRISSDAIAQRGWRRAAVCEQEIRFPLAVTTERAACRSREIAGADPWCYLFGQERHFGEYGVLRGRSTEPLRRAPVAVMAPVDLAVYSSAKFGKRGGS